MCVCLGGGGLFGDAVNIEDYKAFGSGRGLNLVLARHMFGGAEETRRNIQSEYHMHRPSLEPRISRTETSVVSDSKWVM
jgi:hypothetical protein